MDKNSIYISLDKNVSLSKKAIMQKLIRSPIKMLYSQFLISFNKETKIKTKTFWHEDMLVVIPERVSRTLYRYGFFEEGLTKMFLKYLQPRMTLLDIGAHFGYFTLLGSYLVGEKGQVHSFEPIPSTFKILQRNVLKKNNIFINNKAVFSIKTNVDINDYGIKYSAFNSLYAARLPKKILHKVTIEKHEIETLTIDDYIKSKNIKPDFVKIDAEGAEFEALLGMQKTIAEFHPIISIEVGDFDVEGVPISKNLISYLKNKNYQPYEFKDGKFSKHLLKDNQYRYDNILFM